MPAPHPHAGAAGNTTPALSAADHARPAMLVAGAKVTAGAATVGMNLWLAAQLPPSAFGAFATATTALLLCDAVFGSAMDAAVIRTTNHIPAETVTDTERSALL